ncbi:hypothetical protein L7F22_023577 [Adiantum nelumboides]|nr:hypothetical protein [Adiantum nelumboides]
MHTDESTVQMWLHLTESMARSVNVKKVANRRRAHEHRQAWAYPRLCQMLHAGAYHANMFKWRLRVSKETFHYLCGSLAPFMQKKTTNFRAAVSIEDRVAIALSRLATGDGLMGLDDTYGCAKSTCCGIVLDFCKAIVTSGLRNMYIRWPSQFRLATLAREFEVARGIPFVVGAIDGFHIPIIAPRDNHVDYFNRKGFHSILLQLTIAANCSIWNYDVGWAGSGHDSLNFSRSDIGQACARGELGSYCLVGDCAYPARPYMLVPFKGCKEGLSRLKYYWNFIQSSTKMPVERAFGMLKARFHILLKRCDMNLRYVPDLIAACLVLHNICIQHGESFDMEWVCEAEAELTVRSGRAEEGQSAVATSLRELQATREVDIEDVMERAQGGNEGGASDLILGSERRDSLARTMYREHAKMNVLQVFGRASLEDMGSSSNYD